MKKMMIALIGALMLILSISCLVLPKKEISGSERRRLKQFPDLKLERVLSGAFMNEFEGYATDQFPMRELWRKVKSFVVTDVFFQSDYEGYYEAEGHIVKTEYPLKETVVRKTGALLAEIGKKAVEEKNCKVYYSVIPDKQYFLTEGHLTMDYDRMFEILQEELKDATYIDIAGGLTLFNYYRTDTHWRQETLVPTAEALLTGMGSYVDVTYEMEKVEIPFYGVYAGQSAFRPNPDELWYLTPKVLNEYRVFDFQNERACGIYDWEKANGSDPYELFLSGPVSLMKIENPNLTTGKRLVLFRDSFGSSIAPLLAAGYEELFLVDVRYISSKQLEKYIDFTNADVLFLYSTSVLNHSESFR